MRATCRLDQTGGAAILYGAAVAAQTTQKPYDGAGYCVQHLPSSILQLESDWLPSVRAASTKVDDN